jgi:CelD/BcsL family acetyltransferase involved in cellulose biosynthesis
MVCADSHSDDCSLSKRSIGATSFAPILPASLMHGYTRLFQGELTIDSGVVSARYCFLYNGRFYDAILARDIEYSYYNVGHIHTMYLIKDAIARSLREFDFLSGDEPYKFHWTKSSRKYLQIIVIKRGLCPHLRLKFLRILLRFHETRQYGLRELYPRYMIRRREERERKKMGGGTPV